MQSGHRDLLVEVGTEELPPLALEGLAHAFENGLRQALEGAGVPASASERYATPRRLAVLLRNVPERQADRQLERKGPALATAFDDGGKPTKAAQGFARACGVSVDQLETLEAENGSWLLYREMKPGDLTAKLVPGLLQRVLAELPAPKRMRWGSGKEEFVRPVHWLLLLFGTEVLPCEVFAIRADCLTRGHRFHCPDPIRITSPDSYVEALEHQGHVIPSFEHRRERIREQVSACAEAIGGHAVISPELLDEVTALVEWPVSLVGSFEERFLETPREALISTMQDHQKYFPVVAEGREALLPHFVAVSNLESRDPAEVRRGNERVIRPRFADAEFFWNQDRKRTLASRRSDLKRVIYEQRLGSLFDKSERVADMAAAIAERIEDDPVLARRSGELCKCDLLTSMVYEFPELQGIMGRHYAGSDGENEALALAIEEQYLPRFAGDSLPTSRLGQAVAIADRIDTLAATFALGKQPTGAKDPFGLRRAGLAVLRILIEQELPLDLRKLFTHAFTLLPTELQQSVRVDDPLAFVMDRLRTYYLDAGIGPDVFAAVAACVPTIPLDFHRRVRALEEFTELEACASLTAANKRIRNILRRADSPPAGPYSAALFELDAEVDLAGAVEERRGQLSPLIEAGDYRSALARLAELRRPVDRFFDEVMVMVDDPSIRDNRLALLADLQNLFLEIADISQLQSAG